jgi:hypothetical protein
MSPLEPQEIWLQRQAIELLAQHIPFETDPAVKAECIEELRALARRFGPQIDRALFGFEARLELQRLDLWKYFSDSRPLAEQEAGASDVTYSHGRAPDYRIEFEDDEDVE